MKCTLLSLLACLLESANMLLATCNFKALCRLVGVRSRIVATTHQVAELGAIPLQLLFCPLQLHLCLCQLLFEATGVHMRLRSTNPS